MAGYQLYPGEVMLKEGQTLVKEPGKRIANGKGWLTNQRFVSFKRSVWLRLGVGILFSYAFRGRFNFDIPLTSIKSFYKSSLPLNKNVLAIETMDGKEYKIGFDLGAKAIDWAAGFSDALMKYHNLRAVEVEPQKWVVQR